MKVRTLVNAVRGKLLNNSTDAFINYSRSAIFVTVFILNYSTNQGPSIAQKPQAGGPNLLFPPPFGISRSVRVKVGVLGAVFT